MRKGGSALVQSADVSIIQLAEGRLNYGGTFNGISLGYPAHDLNRNELLNVLHLGALSEHSKLSRRPGSIALRGGHALSCDRNDGSGKRGAYSGILRISGKKFKHCHGKFA